MVVAASSVAPQAGAAKETIRWKAVTLHRNGESYNKWLWFQEEAAKRTDGRLQVEILTFPEVGLTGTDVLRVIESGLISIAEVSTGYVSGDFPLIEATDLPGMVSSIDQSRKVYDAWLEKVVVPNSAAMGGKVYSTFVWGSIYLFTADPVETVADFRGRKIRVFAPAQARLIEELGGEPVSMPISEVYSALQRGVIDGMITGPDQINPMAAWEVTPYVTDIGIAPLGAYIVISQPAWDALPGDIQQVLTDMQAEFTDVGWSTGKANDELGLSIGRDHGMTINIPANAALQAQLRQVAVEDIAPWWKGRAGAEGAALFDEILLPIVNQQN
ncbi:TRAP transporter substrate-binding protein DctP [Salipiger thiooxidans]|uniref:TRAP transporter substrate-binding protein DctP n=1 Tax=Salipiger thiooxidans TaxID=282683 RepID=UPI001CD5CB80|nr:TRAP transporter substrate-binding protein DctP [Salipiger thiooxidans]MCA0847880.1 TRAP transporter substrate-binding protein DctP [Salipiger thiooxidans]